MMPTKKLKPWERDGTTGFIKEDGTRQCTGSIMGRRSVLPSDPAKPIKLKMERLRFVDGCYDKGGAYWGAPENVWCAYGEDEEHEVVVTCRAASREEAKKKVRESIPGARFFN